MQEIKNTDIYTFNNLLKCCLQYHWRVNHTDLSVMHFVYCTKIDSYIYWLISEETVIVEAFPTHAEYINIYLLEILFWLKRDTRQVAGGLPLYSRPFYTWFRKEMLPQRKKRLLSFCAELRGIAEESNCSAFLRNALSTPASTTRIMKGRYQRALRYLVIAFLMPESIHLRYPKKIKTIRHDWGLKNNFSPKYLLEARKGPASPETGLLLSP